MEILVRRARMSSRCSAPSCVTAYLASTLRYLGAVDSGCRQFGFGLDQVEQLVDRAAVPAEQVLDPAAGRARCVDARLALVVHSGL